MKDIRQIHRAAMELARKANDALLAGDKISFMTFSKESLKLEKEAAFELISDLDAEPTRSVLFRSAATLAYNIGNYIEAKRLIHFALAGEPHLEIIEELELLLQNSKESLETGISFEEATDNSYINLLREKAINLRIEPKDTKYSKAIVVTHIIDFLKNIQTSYQSFSQINFKKNFTESDFGEWESANTIFKQDTKTLCVNLKWNSFGVSIVSDSEIMNYTSLYGEKFTTFKKALFEDFKNEVLLPDLNSIDYQKRIIEKYSAEERYKIFSPIIETLKEKSQYNVSVADRNFKSIIKTINPITLQSQQILKPKIIMQELENIEPKILKRTFELATLSGKNKQKILSENLDYAELKVIITELSFGDKKVNFNVPFEYKIIFDHGSFIIDEDSYKLFIEDENYDEIQKLFEKKFIEKYDSLLAKIGNLNVEEITLLQMIESISTRTW